MVQVPTVLERAVLEEQLGADHPDIVLLGETDHLGHAARRDHLGVVVQQQDVVAACGTDTTIDLVGEVERLVVLHDPQPVTSDATQTALDEWIAHPHRPPR